MKKINELAIQYKNTNDRIILNEIFKLLYDSIQEKTKYIFYKQDFVKNRYQIKIWNSSQKKYKSEKRVNTFKLCNSKKIEISDVEQELKLEILRIIRDYDVKLPFENYLNSSLINWRPSFIRKKNFMEVLSTINESELINEEEEESPLNNLMSVDAQYPEEHTDILSQFGNLTKKEKILIQLISSHPEKNQTELAEIIGVTQQRIAQMKQILKNKYKKTCNSL